MTTTPTRPSRNTTSQDRLARDAAEFGLHVTQGGWRLGLLVARNVVVSPGRVSAESLAPKTNATRYARLAGTSNDRVLRYLNAWEQAADDGLVPHAAALTPGAEIDLDADRLPAWSTYYRPLVRRTSGRTSPPPAPVPSSRAPEAAVTAVDNGAGLSPEAAAAERAEAVRRQRETDAQRLVETIHREEQQRNLAAQADQAAIAAEALEVAVAGARYRAGLRHRRTPDHNERLNAAAEASQHASTEVAEIIGKLRWFSRRLFDLARSDDEWPTNAVSRRDAAEELAGLARRLGVIAEIAADPERAHITDEAIQQLMNGKP